jgi:hypothetical protein
MIRIVFFHDQNWKIKGYKVEYGEGAYKKYPIAVNYINGLLTGTRLALEELKAFHLKSDTKDVYEVVVTRQNKLAAAALKPLELGVKCIAVEDRDAVEVLQF